MKKKKIILIALVIICVISVCYSLYYFHIRNNIVFHTYNEELTVLWGQNLNEKKDDFYHLNKGSSDNYICNLIYDDSKINQVQDLVVEVKHYMITVKKTFKLIIVDEEKPIIKYNNKKEEVSMDFDIGEYLEVYDQRLLDNVKINLTRQEDITSKYNNKGGYYYYTEGHDSKTYVLEKGLNKIHVVAWDGHGNESEEIFQVYVK